MKRLFKRLTNWVNCKSVDPAANEQETIYGGERLVNGEVVATQIKTIANMNIITVEVGTNGLHGGDSGHGCRTYFRITNEASTDMDVRVSMADHETNQVEIMFGGDSELDTFIEALEFAAETLRKNR